jgi:glycosyltransferase involved in cell wall biosynthesis
MADRIQAMTGRRLKILLTSYFFYPSIGGIESVSLRLAQDFVAMGHEVKVATMTGSPIVDEFPFEVARRPGPFRLLAMARWCDVYFQNNISLKFGWPLLLVRRPWVVAHHTYIARVDMTVGWRDRIKKWLLRYAENVVISGPVAKTLPVKSTIIGNPYDENLFRLNPGMLRDRELIFVGRLVSDKGVSLILEALAGLQSEGLRPRLTIVGEGPELPALREMVVAKNLGPQVEFLGYKTGPTLVDLLNRHSILVVPSRWPEPFGLIAVEGIACGCVVVGSENGGLKEAIGDCGLTFPNNSAAGLQSALRSLLANQDLFEGLRRAAPAHLRRFHHGFAAARYLEVFARAAGISSTVEPVTPTGPGGKP